MSSLMVMMNKPPKRVAEPLQATTSVTHMMESMLEQLHRSEQSIVAIHQLLARSVRATSTYRHVSADVVAGLITHIVQVETDMENLSIHAVISLVGRLIVLSEIGRAHV